MCLQVSSCLIQRLYPHLKPTVQQLNTPMRATLGVRSWKGEQSQVWEDFLLPRSRFYWLLHPEAANSQFPTITWQKNSLERERGRKEPAQFCLNVYQNQAEKLAVCLPLAAKCSYPASAAVRDCREQSKRRSSSRASPKLFCWWEQRTTWAALDPASACESCSGNPWLHLILLLVPLCPIYLLTTVHRERLHIWNAHASRVPRGKAFYVRVKATWISYSSANACSWMHKDQAPEDNFEEQMQMGKYQICLEAVH